MDAAPESDLVELESGACEFEDGGGFEFCACTMPQASTMINDKMMNNKFRIDSFY